VRRLIIAATALATALPTATPATALEWSRPILLEPTPPGFDVPEGPVTVAANARGDAIAVWVRERLSDQGTTCCDDERVIASYRPAGGHFGKPEMISRLGDEATAADVAIDPAGNAFAAWVVNDVRADLEITPGGVGMAARRAGARRFERPRLLSKLPASDVHVTAGAVGQAVVAWERLSRPAPHDLLYPRQVMAALQSGPARFGRPVAVSGLNAASDLGDGVRLPVEMNLRAATDRGGATYLSYAREDGSSNACCRAVEVTRRSPGGAFEKPSAASGPLQGDPEFMPAPLLASRPAGGVISWVEGSTLVTRDWAVGQPLGAPTTLDLPPGSLVEALGVADDGTATALVGLGGTSGDTLDFTLASMRRPPGGAFGPTEQIARSGAEAVLLVDPAGPAHAIWTRFTKAYCYRSDCRPAGPRIDAADAPAGGAFGNVRNVASRDNGSGPTISRVRGGAVAGWLGDHGPWVAGLGARSGRSPVPHAMRGPRLRRFAKHGRRTFTFWVSRPARVLIDITRVESGHEEIRRVGQAAVYAHRGAGRLTLPRRIRLLRGRDYVATLIAQDTTGHDSASIAPVYFRGG
jgi:hypothetical protein